MRASPPFLSTQDDDSFTYTCEGEAGSGSPEEVPLSRASEVKWARV
jgi:hypothetical protein